MKIKPTQQLDFGKTTLIRKKSFMQYFWLILLTVHTISNVINRGFHKPRLQDPAPLKTNSSNIPFATKHYHSANKNTKIKKICKKFIGIQSGHLNNVFKNSNIILGQKQGQNLLRLLSQARFNTDNN